jgi:hypothetical protein
VGFKGRRTRLTEAVCNWPSGGRASENGDNRGVECKLNVHDGGRGLLGFRE